MRGITNALQDCLLGSFHNKTNFETNKLSLAYYNLDIPFKSI